MKFLQLNDIDCYKKSLNLSNYVWGIVIIWDHYSFGSLKESLDWNEKAKTRKLLTEEQYQHILRELQTLPKEINQLIQFTNQKLRE
ncbi:MAG TPA: four helix bundle protein [Patescibacteria group bacterium]|nr:four helix bundle protein [Patescibacteria group bacterium]